MLTRGDFFENRVTGERAVVLRGQEAGEGAPMVAHLTVAPHGAVAGEHVHPSITERFTVISGTLGVRLEGEELTLSSGEVAVARPRHGARLVERGRGRSRGAGRGRPG